MHEEMKTIRNSSKASMPADKTRNLCELDKKSHVKLLQENITKSYKKCSNNIYNEMNAEVKDRNETRHTRQLLSPRSKFSSHLKIIRTS